MVALNQNQKYSSGITHDLVGVRSFPLFSFISIVSFFTHLLYLFLGLGNNVCSNFKNFISIRIEKNYNEEIEAKEMSFLAEIRHNEALILLTI